MYRLVQKKCTLFKHSRPLCSQANWPADAHFFCSTLYVRIWGGRVNNPHSKVSCRLMILCDKQIVYCNSASTGQAVLMLHCLKQRWARSRSLILIFKITSGDLNLLGDLDQFHIDLDLWSWSLIFYLQFSRSLLHPTLTCKLWVIWWVKRSIKTYYMGMLY